MAALNRLDICWIISAVQGLSRRYHPMQPLRESMSRDGVLRTSEIAHFVNDTRVRIAGYVVSRQAPGTVEGHVFLTLEDEQGLVNIVLKPRVYEKDWYTARREPLVVVEGVFQKKVVSSISWPSD